MRTRHGAQKEPAESKGYRWLRESSHRRLPFFDVSFSAHAFLAACLASSGPERHSHSVVTSAATRCRGDGFGVPRHTRIACAIATVTLDRRATVMPATT